MGSKTKIEYCDSTINPVMGCPGCELYPDHCYAAALCNRYAGRKGWPEQFNQPEHFPHRLPQALGWPDLTGRNRPDKPWLNGRPRIVFVNDLGDGFAPGVDPDEWLTPHIEAMRNSPHVWLFLTKWPERMVTYFKDKPFMTNAWLGTTVTSWHTLARAERLKMAWGQGNLWLSAEPLLGPLNLEQWDPPIISCFDWIAAGGESGAGARLSHADWFREIRDTCQIYSIPFFFKQWGGLYKHDHRKLDGQQWNEVPW